MVGEVGSQLIEFLFDQMQVDHDWSVSDDDGFEWWGWKLRQRVWTEDRQNDSGLQVSKISLATDVLADVPDSDKTYSLLSFFNGIASINAFVYEPEEARISLRATAYVHEENVGWMSRFVASACAIQAADAHARGPAMVELTSGRLDATSHPASGERIEMDDMLNVLHVFAERGSHVSPFTSDEVDRLNAIDPVPWLMANADDDEFVAEFPFSSQLPAAEAIAVGEPIGSSMLKVDGSVSNPQLGSGAGFRLQLPISLEEAAGHRLANQLNLAEFNDWTGFPLTGAWSGLGPSFEMFLPAAMFRPGLLAAMVFYQAGRANWIRQLIAEQR